MSSIPIIDLGKLEDVENVSENPEWIGTAEEFRSALGTVGFLYLINHGFPEAVLNQAYENGKEFFRLPAEKKMEYKRDTSNVGEIFDYEKYFGYTPAGAEILNGDSGFDIKEAFDWTNNPNCRFPDKEVNGFEANIVRFNNEITILTKRLLKLTAMALKLDDVDFFLRKYNNLDDPVKHPGIRICRMNHYPPISDEVYENGKCNSARCGEHTDYVFLTILFQDNVGGLEVKTVDGEWINAKPIPGSIVINAGDLMEFWTGGAIPATPHRVLTPEVDNEKRKKSRYSIVVVCGPDNDTTVAPLDLEKRPAELERLAKNPKKYRTQPVNAYDHVMRRCADMTY